MNTANNKKGVKTKEIELAISDLKKMDFDPPNFKNDFLG